jgi:hypothetical protein
MQVISLIEFIEKVLPKDEVNLEAPKQEGGKYFL